MKILFVIILFIHGLIHLMGFAKAFKLAEVSQLTQNISRPIGLLWLLCVLMFIATCLFFIFRKDWWPIIALTAIILSQILIVLNWTDAKYGTLINLVILIVSLPAYGNYGFVRMVRNESLELFENNTDNPSRIGHNNTMANLPPIVQKWLVFSGVKGHKKAISVRLKQEGEMRTKPDGNWMPFTATQYYNIEDPSFVWTTKVRVIPMVHMYGRDKLKNGKGEMLIKLLSLIPVVNNGGTEQINQGSMLRFLAEMCWYPSAALNDYISWQTIDTTSAKATFELSGQAVSGIFKFSNEGKMNSFEADRYYGGGKDAKMEKWMIEIKEYRIFNGHTLPYKCQVTWKFSDDDFNWLNLKVIDLEFNVDKLY